MCYLLGQSAGNFVSVSLTGLGSSETIREKSLKIMSNRAIISVHAPKARKPQTEEEFGFFLVGLIDADGYLNKSGYMVICFNKTEASAAYYIKGVLGYGSVKAVKNKSALTFTLSHPKGLAKLRDLVWNKLRHLNRINPFNNRLLAKIGDEKTSLVRNQDLKDNHWLAGFIECNGSFQIQILTRPSRMLERVRLVVQIDQKTDELLNLIKNDFGGYVGYRHSQDTYYYSSVSLKAASQLIVYLDRYQVLSVCLTRYWLWRKAFLLVQAKAHLREAGLTKLRALKARLEKL